MKNIILVAVSLAVALSSVACSTQLKTANSDMTDTEASAKPTEVVNTDKNVADTDTKKSIDEQYQEMRLKQKLNFEQRKNDADAYLVPEDCYDGVSLYGSILDEEILSLLRNEIYARYGYIFKKEAYKSYFESKTWYAPNKNFSEDMLSEEDILIVERYKTWEEDIQRFYSLPENIQTDLKNLSIADNIYVSDIKENDRFYQITTDTMLADGSRVFFVEKTSGIVFDWIQGDMFDFECDTNGFYQKNTYSNNTISDFTAFVNVLNYAEANNIKLGKYFYMNYNTPNMENYDAPKKSDENVALHQFSVDMNSGAVTMIK